MKHSNCMHLSLKNALYYGMAYWICKAFKETKWNSVLNPEDIESLPGLPPEMSGRCFNRSALVSIADGSLELTQDVCIGDVLIS